ncbi:uncharacterized protein CXorf51A-like [Ochotona curzoniae]|uniref:uncharacterized protein CXorf51A-like n=1 Tax=Ochotona curzoniae TaxID=130825 RepID=UPI001B34AF09|nr:uncharacterized protein CXorf51A-like [Ochotona curzoniae]
MGKAVKKIDVPDIDMEQPASSSKNKRKTPCQSKSKGSKKVPKTTTKGRTIQGSASKKVSEKTATSVKKTKKAKGTILFGHYHRLNEKLSKSETKEEKKADNSTNSSDGQDN